MFNARLVIRRSPGIPVEPVAMPKLAADIEHNYEAMLPLMVCAVTRDSFPIPSSAVGSRFDALYGVISHENVLTALRSLRWVADGYFDADLRYFEELAGAVDDWVVLVPQLTARGMSRTLPGVGNRSLFQRTRTRDPLFQAVSDPKYRHVGLRIAGSIDDFGDPLVEGLHKTRRGSIMLYPIVEELLVPATSADELPRRDCIIGFTIVVPSSATPAGLPLVQFETYNQALANQPIVPRPV